MTLGDARKILGLGPDDDPRPCMRELLAERENLAATVRDAANDAFAMRHQERLVRFDQALATIRETLEALGLDPHMEDTAPITATPPVVVPTTVKRSRWPRMVAVVCLLGLMAAGGAGVRFHLDEEHRRAEELETRIAQLDTAGNAHIENRRWAEAETAFLEIQRLSPTRPTGKLGLARIEVGIAEERSQFIGYWTGEARAALDSARWDDAEAAARKVLERFPDQPDAMGVLDAIAGAKLAETRRMAVARANELLDLGDAESALAAAKELAGTYPGDDEVAALLERADATWKQQHADRSRATELFEKARLRDTGSFDEQALEWLREAALLAPDDEAIAAHLEKMASYTRTIRVPGDVADLEEAIASARQNDRILIGPGTWQGTFVVNLPIELQGAGPLETIIECNAIAGCAITLGPAARGTRVSGITFRHAGFDPGNDRYSTALVRGGAVEFVDCHFIDASGHGLAVIEGADVAIQRCQFRGNGWNGLAAIGEKSSVRVSDSAFVENFGHGVEVWDQATAKIHRCRIAGNTGNAIHLDTTANDIRIEACELVENREYGIVLTKAAGGHISKNRIHQNQLGGVAIRKAAAGTRVEGNTIEANSGPGILLEQGIDPAASRQNTIQRNQGAQVLTLAQPTGTPNDR